jgi:hypothetical protein
MWSVIVQIFQALGKTITNGFLAPTIDISERSSELLVLRSRSQTVVVDRAKSEVSIDNNSKIKFSSIKTIDIIYRKATSDWPELWTIRLNVSWLSSPVVGQTTNSTDASIAAARISTLIAKKVRSL